MARTRVFEVLESRGQKQRWLLLEMARRGYRLSEGYLSQIKAGTKAPTRRFVDLACEILSLAEAELFPGETGTLERQRRGGSRAVPAAGVRKGERDMGT